MIIRLLKYPWVTPSDREGPLLGAQPVPASAR